MMRESLRRAVKSGGFEQLQIIEHWQDQTDVYAVLLRKVE
jgi:hypothetical protein